MLKIILLGQEYFYRRLTRREYKELKEKSNEDPVVFEDEICKLCVTPPIDFPGWDDCLAGIPYTLATVIMEESGFLADENTPSRIAQEAYEWANSLEGRLDSLICFVFPTQTPDMLEDMDPLLWSKYAAMSQSILAGIHGVDPSTFINPTPPKQKVQPTSPFTPKPQGVAKQLTEIQQEGIFSFTAK